MPCWNSQCSQCSNSNKEHSHVCDPWMAPRLLWFSNMFPCLLIYLKSYLLNLLKIRYCINVIHLESEALNSWLVMFEKKQFSTNSLQSQKVCLFFEISDVLFFCFWFGGHTWYCSGISTGSVLRYYYWQCWRNHKPYWE